MRSAISEAEWKTLIKHGRTAVGMENGISIEGNQTDLDSIKNCKIMQKLIKHELLFVRGTAKNIVKTAEKNMADGWSGDGVYLID